MIYKFDKFDKVKRSGKLNEVHEVEHYMFFANLETIKRLTDKMLSMDKNELDQMLKEHDWANDHISTSKDDIEEVFNFIASTEIYKNDSEESESNIQGFDNLNK
jgi:hypothetical protein